MNNAALSLQTILPPPYKPDTLPPPSGERPVASARAEMELACDGYATIDLPSHEVSLGPVLVVIEAPSCARPLATRTLQVGQEIALGSSAEADVLVADPTVSGRHVAVVHVGRFVEVIDLGSRNGVHVGGARVERALCGAGGSFAMGRVIVRLERAADLDGAEHASLEGVVGRSLPMRRLGAAVRGVASMRLPVLLRGESGTGKDVIARAIHQEGSRAKRPFVALNAATIRPELAESELFGHDRGAFTGAVRERRGAFREASGGTLFLDEIAQLPLDVQAKLLRVVEEGTVRPLGGETEHRVDVRLVVATCEPLEAMVRERRFRPDLYQRLAVCVLKVPALRDRVDDIPILARHLLAASEVGARELSPCAVSALCRHSWPGNVRELRNVLLQAAILAPRGPILAPHVHEVLGARDAALLTGKRIDAAEALRIFEECNFNVSAAARRADLPRTTMRDLLRQAGAPLGMKKTKG
ncbi:MAG: sigma 54-interacting transcriptional regulator [Polyangiaceae bacterium]